ncbi:MAG: cytochrome c oxidase subunit II [Phycisphaerales bacterium]|nr:cytochrome c oxidase subunit II [Phycisphaerales bacterium]
MNMPSLSILTLGQAADPLTRAVFREHGASALARDTDSLMMWIFGFDVIWFVFLMALMLFWVVKYRRRPGVPAQRSPHHNTPLELAWTILPSVFLGYMFYRGFESYIAKLIAPTDSEVINVVGQKWEWTFTYPNGASPPEKAAIGGNEAAPILYIPVGRPIQFRMTSNDVLHSFWIPDFRFKFDVMPNRYTSYWIQAEEPGDHWIFCAEYCGDKHSEMAGLIRAVTPEEYAAKVSSWQVSGTPAERGFIMVNSKGGCFACHTITGSPGIGPTWKNAWGNEVKLADGSTIPADNPEAWDNYIRESILNPNAKIHAGFPSPSPMSSFAGTFTEEQIGWIVEYIKSLSDKAPAQPDAAPKQ